MLINANLGHLHHPFIQICAPISIGFLVFRSDTTTHLYQGAHKVTFLFILTGIYCGEPFHVGGSYRIVTGHYYNDTATYTCQTGYSMVGSNISTCTADQHWSTPPECEGR